MRLVYVLQNIYLKSQRNEVPKPMTYLCVCVFTTHETEIDTRGIRKRKKMECSILQRNFQPTFSCGNSAFKTEHMCCVSVGFPFKHDTAVFFLCVLRVFVKHTLRRTRDVFNLTP